MHYRKWPWRIRKIRAAGYRPDEPYQDDDSEDSLSSEGDEEGERYIEDDCLDIKVMLDFELYQYHIHGCHRYRIPWTVFWNIS